MDIKKAKELGAFYTDETAVDFLIELSYSKSYEKILEPSFGDLSFVRKLINVYPKEIISGYEIDLNTYQKSNSFYPSLNLIHDNFLNSCEKDKYDLIIGNPPFIRTRKLEKKYKKLCDKSVLKVLGNDFVKDYNLFLAFITHSFSKLNNKGCIAFVLPYDITFLRYFYRVWHFLLENFGDISVIRTKARYFQSIQQDTVLLVAKQKGKSSKNLLYRYGENFQKLNTKKISFDDLIYENKPFNFALLNDHQHNCVRKLINEKTEPISNFFKVNIGYVTGDKTFFHPDEETISKFKINPKDLLNCITEGKSLNSKLITSKIHSDFSSKLFYPENDSKPNEKYIKEGVKNKVNKRYKCKVRNPWYKTPLVAPPDFVMNCFSRNPNLILNDENYFFTNSFLCFYQLNDEFYPEEILLCWYTSITLLFSELYNHSLGGGMTIYVPKEILKIRLPIVKIDDYKNKFSLLSEIEDPIKRYEFGDRYILKGILGFSEDQVVELKEIIKMLKDWRENNF